MLHAKPIKKEKFDLKNIKFINFKIIHTNIRVL